MSPRSLIVLAGSTVLLASCGNKNEGPPLAGRAGALNGVSGGLYFQAKQADDAGNRDKAIKLYTEAADRSPGAANSGQARYREAQLLEAKGETLKAFDAYQKFLERYATSNLYSKALSSQASMAEAAANGSIKTNFLGIKSGLSLEKVIGMLGKVRDNAPRSATAAHAQFNIARLYQRQKKEKESIEAYGRVTRDYPDRGEASESQFRIGQVYLEQAQRGNQNAATLNLARDAFQDYIGQYPGGSHVGEARKYLSDLGGRSVQRTYDIAEFYLKTGQTESAKVYYREVIRKGGNGPLYGKAKARLAGLGEH